MSSEPNYGAAGSASIWEKIRILQEWSPLVTYVQAFLATHDPHGKSIVVADACEWLASKSKGTKVDDELVQHVTAVLKSPQGEALLRWVVSKVTDGADA